MKKVKRLKLILSFLFFIVVFQLQATTYYSNNANISSVSNWWTATNGTGSHPANFTTASDIFIVQSGHTNCTLGSSLTIGSGVTLQVNENLNVNWQSITINGTITPSASKIISNTNNITGSGVLQVTRTNAENDNFSTQYTGNKTLTNLTVEYVGGAQQYYNFNGGVPYKLKISNNTTLSTENWPAVGYLEVASSKTFNLQSYHINVRLGFTNNGTISGSATDAIYTDNANSTFSIDGNGTYPKVKLGGGSGPYTITGNNTFTKLDVVSGNLTLNCGTTTTLTDMSVSGGRSVTGPTSSGNRARVVNTNAVSNSGTIGASSSYIIFSSTISGGTVGANVTQSSGTAAACTPPGPTLTAAVGATVDAAFNVTFADNAAWRAAITSITIDGSTLTGGYSVAAGQITFTPASSNPTGLLRTNGTKSIVVIATGYINSTVSQAIGVGTANKLGISVQPSAPSYNGATLSTQPIILIQDQYGNTTTSTATVNATVGAGGWTIGGTTGVAGVTGTSTFTNLSAAKASAVVGATIIFTSTGLTPITSGTFDIPGIPSITLASVSQVSAANIEQSAVKQTISAFTFAVTTANAHVSAITFTTGGNYAASDVTKFQLWYNTSNSLGSASQIGTEITASLGVGSHTFSSLTQSITAGNTGYFWITTNVASAATITKTINVSAISTSDVTFSVGSKSGSITAGGTQTIIAATRITYYSRVTGNWNSNSTWSTVGCGGVAASAYPTATDNVVICNTYTVTANIDVVTTGQVTVNSGGTLTVSNNVEIDAPVTIESGGAINWPSTIEIGANANIVVNGNVSAGSTTIVFQDAYAGATKGKITATGTMAFSQVKSSASVKGGSLKASSITIGTYGQNEVGVDVAFEGTTTVATYMGYGYTYFTNGDLTITNYNSTNPGTVTENEFVSDNSDLIFTNYVTAKNSSLQTNISGGGDIYFNAGFENAYTGAQSTRLIADNVYLSTSIKGEGGTNLYIEANVVQQSNVIVNQNSNGNIYIKNNFESNGFGTNFNNTNATFKVEGNSRFDNISGHLNSGGSIITLGDSYMKGTGTFGANDGSIYVGRYLTIETVQVSFQGTAKGYIGGAYTAATFETGGVYDDANYNSDLTIGGSGFHPRNSSNNADANGGNYLSKFGGQITSASMISNLAAGALALDVAPESWELPIKLISFYVKNTNKESIQIAWETATEENNNYFTLYRSNNGVIFEPIAEISGAGNSSMILEYEYTDYTFFPGITYYKLSQTDYDGSITYSNIITANQQSSNFEIVKLCNPNSEYCILEIQFSAFDESNNLMIANILGEIVFQQIFYNTAYERIEIILPPGIYTVINSTLKSSYETKILIK